MTGMFSIMQLTSLTTVVAAAVFLTWVAKRSLAMVPWANCVPVFVYTAIIAAILTYIASRITHTLEGQTGILIVDAIINGALASGLREWFTTSTTPLSDSGTALKVRAELKGNYVAPPRSWLLPFLLVGSLAAASCGGAIKPPVITPDDQVQVRQVATKALAGIEIAGIVVRDSRQLVSDLAGAGIVPVEFRSQVNQAVIRANEVVQRGITEIAAATREVTVKGLVSQVSAAMGELASVLERSSDGRVQTAGKFLRSAIAAVVAMVGGGL